MKQSIVFYADILGFKEMVSLNKGADNDATFVKLKDAINTIDKSMLALQKANRSNTLLNDTIAYKMFSDSFYLSVAFDLKSKESLNMAIWLTFYIARLYQDTMLMHQILIRGAIAKGEDHNEKNFIFSPALIAAYNLENTVAIYPRIVIQDEIIDDLRKANKQTQLFHGDFEEHDKVVIYDWTGIYFLNPFVLMDMFDMSVDIKNIVPFLGYGVSLGATSIFLKDEISRLKNEKKRKELDKNLWMARLFYWVGMEGNAPQEEALLYFKYLSFSKK